MAAMSRVMATARCDVFGPHSLTDYTTEVYTSVAEAKAIGP